MKRFLTELSTQELEKVLEVNERLVEDLTETLWYQANFEVTGILKEFGNAIYDYSLGDCVYSSYIRVKQYYYKDFLEAFQEVNNEYCIVEANTDTDKLFERLLKKAEFFDDCVTGYVDISEKQFELLEKWFDAGIEVVKDRLITFFDYMYENAYDTESQLDEIENSDSYSDIYIIDDTYKAYRDVTECYARV